MVHASLQPLELGTEPGCAPSGGSGVGPVELAREAPRLQERFAERAADAHRLADRLHLRAERRVGAGELLEREARELDDDVVEGRLEACGRRPGEVVGNLVERVADRELGGDLRDQAARRLRGQGGRAGDRGFISITRSSPLSRLRANWMFEPPQSTPTARMTAIAASRGSWYAASDSVIWGATVTESPVWTPIGSMFSIEQTTTALSSAVAHQLELELVPAEERLLDEHLADRALEPARAAGRAPPECVRCLLRGRPA